VRDNIFNANDFSLKLDGQPRPRLRQNQFGASFGGPIPKNKTFFFVEYQSKTDINGETAGAGQIRLAGLLAHFFLEGKTSSHTLQNLAHCPFSKVLKHVENPQPLILLTILV